MGATRTIIKTKVIRGDKKIIINNSVGFSVENLTPMADVAADENDIYIGFEENNANVPLYPESSRPYAAPSNSIFSSLDLYLKTGKNKALVTVYHLINEEVL